MADERLRQIFANMDRWRHLPCYQLERRFDIFLTPYLLDVIERRMNCRLRRIIVPEFPLKKEASRQSEKVDYVLFSDDRRTVYFVELKTDCRSNRTEQDEYLLRAQQRGWPAVLDDLRQIITGCKTAATRRKYFHLLQLLSEAGELSLDDRLLPSFVPGAPARYREEWVTPRPSGGDARIEIVYVQPQPRAGYACITFDEIADLLPDDDGCELTELVRRHLRAWQCEAGSISPRAEVAV